MNGPARRGFFSATRIALARHDTGISHVVERVAPAYRVGRAAFWNVVDFSDLDSRHVPIFREARWNEPDVSPPVWSLGGNGHLFGFQHQIRFADGPVVGFLEPGGRRHV